MALYVAVNYEIFLVTAYRIATMMLINFITKKSCPFFKKMLWPKTKRFETFRGIKLGAITDSEAARNT
jgi:hypothetical protein